MRSVFLSGIVGFTCTVLLIGGLASRFDASTGPIPLNCNRACLENLVDQYLGAVVAHNPKRLPLSADIKYTENDQLMAVGDGFGKPSNVAANTRTSLPIPNSVKSLIWAQ